MFFNINMLNYYYLYNIINWLNNRILVLMITPFKNNTFVNITPFNNFSRTIVSKSIGCYLQILWEEEDEKKRKKKNL